MSENLYSAAGTAGYFKNPSDKTFVFKVSFNHNALCKVGGTESTPTGYDFEMGQHRQYDFTLGPGEILYFYNATNDLRGFVV